MATSKMYIKATTPDNVAVTYNIGAVNSDVTSSSSWYNYLDTACRSINTAFTNSTYVDTQVVTTYSVNEGVSDD